MSGESDLGRLLREMKPELQPGTFLFCSVADGAVPDGVAPLATFREREGLTLVVEKREAEDCGLGGTFEAAWITLTVHSDLAAVGFLAAVASALAREGIPCNAIAAYHHDHLFVPAPQAQLALAALERLRRDGRACVES
ncbi:MAG: ACT domain-containing protein [Thermoanaerobaculia bacterium]